MFSTSTLTMSDEELWRLSCDGDREAFSQIVERYQSLVCSLAYSRCGNLAGSEDLAQETFITAWRHLKELREPAKLRAWLCGIAHRLTANTRRRSQRRGADSVPLELAIEQPSPLDDPAVVTVQREEEALLWRTLGALPENYREPLILFYREQQSVSQVATQLDLTEETIRQRLSRGRAMLREEMQEFVESTLSRTRPGGIFTTGVLAALPFAASSTGSAGTGALLVHKAASAAKGLLGRGRFGLLGGPAIGLLVSRVISKLIQYSARSEQERTTLARHARRAVIWCFGMSGILVLCLTAGGERYSRIPGILLFGILAWVVALVTGLLRIGKWMQRDVSRIRSETGTNIDPAPTAKKQSPEAVAVKEGTRVESRRRILGIPLYSFAFGSLDSDFYRKQTARGWLAIGDYALSPFLAVGGVAVAPVALGGTTLGCISIGGVSAGGLACGLIAAGCWSLGGITLGWLGAFGAVAFAHGHALGFVAHASDANTAQAGELFRSLWFVHWGRIALHYAIWIFFLGVIPFAAIPYYRFSKKFRSSE